MLTLPVLGRRIERQVKEAEAAANEALAKLAALAESCALARNMPEVGATTGHSTMLRLASASQLFTKGAGEVARAHGELRSLNDDLTVMMPDFDGNCPPATGVMPVAATAA